MNQPTTPPWSPPTSRRRWLLVTVVGLAVAGLVALVLWRQREERRQQDLQLVQGVRKVCKLATVEMSLADYSRKSMRKKFDFPIDLPFTGPSEALLFYAGVVSAGFDVCDEPFRVMVDHGARTVNVVLPPPRILSLDINRFEVINEHSSWLNAIEPADRNQWYQDAREGLKAGALKSGVLAKAQDHAQELFGGFVERWGYKLTLSQDGPAVAPSR